MVHVATRPWQDEESTDGGRTEDREQDDQEHRQDIPTPHGLPTAGLKRPANQEASEQSEEDEASAADGRGAEADENDDGGASLKPSEVWVGAPAGRTASKKLERLGNRHGVELDDRLVELLRYGMMLFDVWVFEYFRCVV